MPSFIRHPKDFWSGVIFLFFGIAAVVISQDYELGRAGKMGPAYFPIILGGLLTFIGIIAVIRSLTHAGEPIEKFHLKELSIILGAVVLFGVLMRGAGLAPAVIVLIVMSAYASPKFRWIEALMLAVGLALFSWLVFVKLLGLPMPILGPWLGF